MRQSFGARVREPESGWYNIGIHGANLCNLPSPLVGVMFISLLAVF